MRPKPSESLIKFLFPAHTDRTGKEAKTCFLDYKPRVTRHSPEHPDWAQRTSGSLRRNKEISEASCHPRDGWQELHTHVPHSLPHNVRVRGTGQATEQTAGSSPSSPLGRSPFCAKRNRRKFEREWKEMLRVVISGGKIPGDFCFFYVLNPLLYFLNFL